MYYDMTRPFVRIRFYGFVIYHLHKGACVYVRAGVRACVYVTVYLKILQKVSVFLIFPQIYFHRRMIPTCHIRDEITFDYLYSGCCHINFHALVIFKGGII